MQIIKRGKNNVLVFTLNEKKTLANPYNLVRMESRTSRAVKRFILPAEQSGFTERFNQFTITETSGAEILTSGVITLKPTGFWDYNIYEQLSSTNTDELLSDTKASMETGIVKVTGAEDTQSYYNKQDKENKFYGTGAI